MQPFFKRMLRQKEAAEQRAREYINLSEASLTVALMCTIAPEPLIGLFRDFTERHPGVRLYLNDGEADAIEAHLTSGQADVAIYCTPYQRSGRRCDLLHADGDERRRAIDAAIQ